MPYRLYETSRRIWIWRIGVKRAVTNGSSEADWPAVAALAAEHPVVLPSYGLHPWDAGNLSPAPPQWTKGPGVSAGRTTGSRVPAPPWWVFTYARSMPREVLVQKCQQYPGERACFSISGRSCPWNPPVAKVRNLSSLGRHIWPLAFAVRASRVGADRP